MKFLELLERGIKKIAPVSDAPEFETRIILEESAGVSLEEIITEKRDVSKKSIKKFWNNVKKRQSSIPIQYITGIVNFMGFEINVNKNVFIPRPETEEMVKLAIEQTTVSDPLCVDICTGSGAISIAYASIMKKSRIMATDISRKSLETCRKNIKNHSLEDRIYPVLQDTMQAIRKANNFDLIISNPPYIPLKEVKNLPPVVRNEPEIAFNGGRTGTKIINSILKYSSSSLKKGGLVFIEIDKINLPHLIFPEEIQFDIINDQYGRKRILKGVKL